MVATSFAEAVALKEQLKGTAPTPPRTRQRFAAFAEQYLVVHAEQFESSTLARYTGEVAHWIVRLGPNYVDAITAGDIRAAMATMTKKEAAPATVNGRLRVLRQILDDAVSDGLLAANPARSVKALTERRTRGRRGNSLTAEELRRFVEMVEVLAGREIARDIARLLLVLAWTGMRRGEAFALKWSDRVDGELHIERSVWRGEEKGVKTDDPRRVTIVEPLALVLDEQRRWLLEEQHAGLSSGLMFPASATHRAAAQARYPKREFGWHRSASCLDEPIRIVADAAQVTPISPHSFRRTLENLARRAGVDELVRRAQAGWRTETAQALYASVDPAERRAAGEAVVRLVMSENEAKRPGKVHPPGTPEAKDPEEVRAAE